MGFDEGRSEPSASGWDARTSEYKDLFREARRLSRKTLPATVHQRLTDLQEYVSTLHQLSLVLKDPKINESEYMKGAPSEAVSTDLECVHDLAKCALEADEDHYDKQRHDELLLGTGSGMERIHRALAGQAWYDSGLCDSFKWFKDALDPSVEPFLSSGFSGELLDGDVRLRDMAPQELERPVASPHRPSVCHPSNLTSEQWLEHISIHPKTLEPGEDPAEALRNICERTDVLTHLFWGYRMAGVGPWSRIGLISHLIRPMWWQEITDKDISAVEEHIATLHRTLEREEPGWSRSIEVYIPPITGYEWVRSKPYQPHLLNSLPGTLRDIRARLAEGTQART